MQYILTQEEYDALKNSNKKANTKGKNELQKLCTKVANELPVIWEGWSDRVPKPWGCIITKNDEEWYCDNCPVQTICPKEWKSYSQ